MLSFHNYVLAAPAADPEAYYNYGNTLYAAGDYDGAIGYYGHAIKLRPEYWEAHQGLGTCYYAKKDYARALAHIGRACELNPRDTGLASFKAELEGLAAAPSSPPMPQVAEEEQEQRGGKGGKMMLSIKPGLCFGVDGRFEKLAGGYPGQWQREIQSDRDYWKADGWPVVDVDEPAASAEAKSRSLGYIFGLNMRIGDRFLVGLDVLFRSSTLFEMEREKTTYLENESLPAAHEIMSLSHKTSREMSGRFFGLCPTFAAVYEAGFVMLVGRIGIGFARSSFKTIYNYRYDRSYEDEVASSSDVYWYESEEQAEGTATGMMILIGGEAVVPLLGPAFASIGIDYLRAHTGTLSGSSTWSWSNSNDLGGVGGNIGVWMDGTDEAGTYSFEFVSEEDADAAKADGAQEVDLDYGGVGLRLGLGLYF